MTGSALRPPRAARPLAASIFLSLAVLVLAAPAAFADDLPTPTEIFQRYVRAIGGEKAILAKEHRTVHGTISLPSMGIEGTYVAWASAPDKTRESVEIAALGSQETGFDGRIAWTVSSMTGPSIAMGTELEQRRLDADFYSPLHYLQAYSQMKNLGEVDVDGRNCWKILVTTRFGTERTLYFDAGTGLMAGLDETRSTELGELPVVMRFSGYRDFGGLQMATEVNQTMFGQTQKLVTTDVDYDPILEDKYQLPKEVRAALEE